MVSRGRDPDLPRVRSSFESISEAATAGFRVFLAGKEVTNDVQSLKIQLHDGNQTSMAQLVLNNELDKYVITPDEMAQLAGVDLSELVFQELGNKSKQFNQLSAREKAQAAGTSGNPAPDLFNGAKVKSGYGLRPHPITGEPQSFHHGIDYAAKTGEPVISPYDGEVTNVGFQPADPETGRGAGHFIVYKTADNHFVRVFHFDEAPTLQPGDKVEAGKTSLGKAGSSGGSTGPHIHLEIRKPRKLRDGTVVPDRSSSGSVDPALYPSPGPNVGDDGRLPENTPLPGGYKRAPDDRVIDAESLEDLIEGELPGLASKAVEDTFNDIFPGELNKIKRELIQDKFFRGQFIKNDKFIFVNDVKREESDSQRSNSQGPFPRLDGWVPRYQIYSGSAAFHTQDIVRIFLQDPYDPYVWYYGFTGYLTDESDVLDVNGNKTVEFTCEDVTRPFKYSRFTVNPQIVNTEVLTLVTDTVIYSGFKEPFNKLTIPESIFFQVFGGEPLNISNEDLGIEAREPTVNSGGDEGIKGEKINFLPGVGNFDIENSKIFIYGDEPNPAWSPNWNNKKEEGERKFYAGIEDFVVRNFSLPEYQATVDCRVRYEDLIVERNLRGVVFSTNPDEVKDSFYKEIQSQITESLEVGFDSTAVPIERSPIWNTITYIGENPELYPTDGRLIMILPGSLNPTTNTAVLVQDFGSFSVTETNFTSKFNMIKQYAERLDFSLYATPRGDLLFEMPFYDFHPDDFYVDQNLPLGANRNIYTFSSRLNNLGGWPTFKGPAPNQMFSGPGNKSESSGEKTPSYSHAFTISRNHQIGNYSRSFSDAAIRTLLTTGYFPIQNFTSVGESRQILGKNIASVAESLVASFGARHETINPHGYISTERAAQLFSEIQLNKINAAATQISIDIDAKFDLFINRPIRIQHKEILGTLRSVTHSIDVEGREISTSGLSLNNARIWSGGVDKSLPSMGGEPRRIYEPIGTEASKPINYQILFENSEKKKKDGTKRRPTARKPKEE